MSNKYSCTQKDFDPIEYINHPNWQTSRLGLERIKRLLELLGRPQDALKFVHVAGTNGKGSTCAYISSILQQAGLRVGMFTSPFIETFEERIQICGKNITYDALKRVTLKVRKQACILQREMGEHPTEFELMTAVALLYFSLEECNVVVLEVGLGGRLDSTNVIDAPEVCVITRIGLDHTSILGSTLQEIAAEKACIIKQGSAACISYPQNEEAMQVIRQLTHKANVRLETPSFSQLELNDVKDGAQYFKYKGTNFKTKLLAMCQPMNAAVALEAVYSLRRCGFNIEDAAIQRGIELAVLPGRFEVMQDRCNVYRFVVDGAHNPQAAEVLASTLVSVFGKQKFVFICGVMADKNYEEILCKVAHLASAFVCVKPNNPRALDASKLAKCAKQVCDRCVLVKEVQSFSEAAQTATKLAGRGGIICTFGSLYMVKDIKLALKCL